MYETEAIVLRAIRYGEADTVLTLYTRERGRVSAIAKGTRKSGSKLGGRLQPGVLVHLGLHEGRGEMHTVRQAQVLEPHAGLWMEGYRLRAAGSVLEAAMRVLGEQEANDAAFNLLARGLALLAVATPGDAPPRHDPIVLGVMAKLLVVAGILPRLGSCASCGATEGLVGFAARVGGALCRDCSDLGEPVDSEVFAAFAALVGRPLSGDRDSITSVAASGVERIVGLVLHEHLGVVLRAAAPL